MEPCSLRTARSCESREEMGVVRMWFVRVRRCGGVRALVMSGQSVWERGGWVVCDIVRSWVLVQSVGNAHASRSSAARAARRGWCSGEEGGGGERCGQVGRPTARGPRPEAQSPEPKAQSPKPKAQSQYHHP